MTRTGHFNIRELTITDEAYPHHLRAIPDHPQKVYVRGHLPPSRRCVACVGTRQPSLFGETAARGIARFLAERGWSIISGLALGVDTLCHEAALKAGGHTVAVLANGLDTVYPRQNMGLAARILENGGALLSEQPPGTRALPQYLIARDRLQSGMSVATIVMQTDLTGGSMHTVRNALLQGRLLIAPVPQDMHAAEPKSRGILALTQRTGGALSRVLEARGKFASLLTGPFASRPVAMALAGRGAYPELLGALETALSNEAWVRPHDDTAPQLELGHLED